MYTGIHQNKTLFAVLALLLASFAFVAQPAQAQCPGTTGGGPSVFYQNCTETAGAGTAAVLTQPTGVAAGNLLLASISTDGTTTPTPADTAGWTNLNTTSAQGATMSLWYRFTPTTSVANRTFNFGANEAYVATYMRFTSAESIFGTAVSGNGDPVAPSITVDRANSLVLRLSVKDFRDTDLTGGLTQITTTASGGGGNGIDTAIGYVSQAGLGGTGLYNFSDTQNAGWIAATLAIRPPKPAVAFRITHSGSGSTCTPTTVTFTAVNEDGGTVTGYTGALTISAPNGNWYAFGDQAGATFNNGTANDGDFTYTMVAGDAGNVSFNYIPNVAGSLNINIASGGITENSHGQGVDQQLTSALCGFTISHDGTHGSCLAAGYQEILISAVESNGTTVRSGYTGTITINTSTTAGAWSAVGGEADGVLTPLGNGNATYQFNTLDAGTATLRFTHVGVNASVNFDIFDTVEPAVDALLAENDLVVTGCGFVISHDGDAPTCAYELITLSSTVAGNTETITVTTSTTAGVWAPESAIGTFTPLANGNFSYAFAPAEGGVATFRLYHQPTATLTFDITGAGMVDVQQGADDPLVFDLCEFIFTAPGTGNNCTAINTTLTVVDQGGFTVAGYTGTVTLTTDSANGFWGQGTATNVPVNNSIFPGDGQATYTFAVGDSGTVSFQLTHEDPGAIVLDANDAFYGMVTPAKPGVNMLACSFWVSVTSPGDTCTPNDVTIEVRNSAGSLVPGFVGTATIATTFANGDWSLNGATSTATFTNFGNGDAQYYFSATSGGSVTLTFTDPIVETTKIIVTTDLLVVDAGHNPDLVIQACRFLISHSGSSDLCTPASVTFTLVDSDDNPVNDYEGQIFISTSLPGNWTDGTTSGINDTGGGSANYQFVAPNSGSATFNFQGLTINTYDIDVTDGSNTDNDGDPGEDPPLNVTACLPAITDFSCVNANNTNITLLSSAEVLGTRAVVMVTGNEGTTAITDALFNGASVSAGGRLHTVANTTNPANQRTITEMFAWLDAELPAAGGSYNGSFTADDGQAMCLVALKNVNQSYPAGAQLGSAFADGGIIQSSLTSPAADAIIISAGTVDEDDGVFNTNTLGNQLVSLGVADDNWTFTAGYGNTVGTGTVTVTETFTGTVDKWTHAIAAFAPAPAPLSYFKITHDGSSTACTMQQVTITAYDVNGNIKNDYVGTITLSMDASHGTWSQFPVTGVLTENPLDDDGSATYQFVVGDGGTKTLNLLVPHVQPFTISVADGSVTDDGTHPTLTVGSCEPIITDTQCYAGTSGSIAIVGPETSGARAVIMSIARESVVGNDPAIDPAQVFFDTAGTPTVMASVVSAKADNGTVVNTTEMYVIFDSDLPGVAGTYNASFTELSGTFPSTPAMCLTAVYGVEQSVPLFPAIGSSTLTVSPTSLTTTVTTAQNNSLVLSVVSDDRTGGNYTSSFGTTLWNNETPPAGAVFSGFSSLKASAGPVSDTVVPSATPNIITHIMAAFSPVVSGPPTADDYVPVTLFKTFSGAVNYRAYGSSYRLNPNGDNALACVFEDSAVGTSVNVDVPPGSTFKGAFLYWSGDGDFEVSPTQIDSDVTLVRGTQTFSISADEMFLIKNVGSNDNLDFFTGYKDVTNIVNTNATYTLRDLTSQNGSPWQDTSACAAGWALVVVYENTLETVQVINLFHGFQPFQNSAFDLVPRNFRIRAIDIGNGIPHGQLTHITIEGDDSPPALNTPNERLGLQSAPGSATFNYLTNSFNPPTAQYNSTVTRPIYDSFLNWTPTAGVNMDGYEALSLTSYGVDVDTHFLRGDVIGSPLYEFGIANPLPEQITTQYSAGQDLVLLVGEVISVTNAPIADLEVTVTEGPAFEVGGTSTYTISLVNNGDGGGPEGGLTGSATVTVTFPIGISVVTGTITATGWNCVANNAPPATPLGLAALACEYSLTSPLAEGGSLPDIVVPVAIGDETIFPNLTNQREINVRALYHGGNCIPNPLDDTLATFGTSPDPDDCAISPQFDNVMDLQGGALSMNDLEEKSTSNNNVDGVFTTINGRQTDLRITKVAAGIFSEGEAATYTITVTNLGPKNATKLITVTDTLVAGLTYTGYLENGDNDAWSCSAIGQAVTCTTDTNLAPGETADFRLGVQLSPPAIENASVSNKATVAIATGNFDTVAANNSSTVTVTVQGQPVASQNKFLISVNLDNTTLGSGTGTLTFNTDDIILYDPVTDVATMFYDDSVDNGGLSGDINALHVRRNGHLIVSPASVGSIAGVNYDVGDLLVYDPLLETATLLFDGSAYFDSPTTNIDAVFEQGDGQVVISTTADAGLNGTTWQMGDWVRFNPLAASPTATVILNGEDPAVFNATVQLNGTYFKVGTPDYVITIGQASANIVTGNTTLTGDDIASLQPGIDSKLEFRGNIPNGVFSPANAGRYIDGVHIVQSEYFGHFAITESVSGDTCTPTTVIIRKDNFDDSPDTTYTGSILIDIDYLGAATWSKIDGDGTLQPTGSGNQYIYTFVPSDNGEVTLALTVSADGVNVNVDVTNGITRESASEDPVLSFNDVVSPVTYADNFTSGDFNGNSGTSNFESGWVETDSDGLGAGTGNVRITAGEVYFDNVPNSETLENNMPALVREVDLSLYTPGTLTLTFDWRTVSVNSGDSFVVEARGDKDTDPWVNVDTFTGLIGTNAGSESYNLTAILSGATQSLSANTQVRFRVAANYNVTGNFIIDDVQLSTNTTDCGVGAVHHYEISHIGYGVMCEAYQITFEAHDVAHTPVAPPLSTVINLSTSAGKGSWSPLPGFPNITDAVLGDGLATYTFGLNQTSFAANFNLTNPLTPTETIHFNIQQGAITELGVPGDVTDPFFTFAESGFIFTNSGGTQTIGVQIAGKRSNLAPANSIFLRAVDTNLDTLECEALFGGQTVQIEMQIQCTNPSSCATVGAQINGTVVPENDNYIPGPGGTLDTNVNVSFPAASAISDEIVLNYPDAGEIQIHAEYLLPIDNDIAGNTEMNYMRGSSQPFVVRPFGFRFDMSANLNPFADDGTPDDGFGNPDASGSAFVKTGQAFNVNLQAIRYVEGSGQDTLVSGQPDPDADLSANPLTPNFGNENLPGDQPVATITHTVTLPVAHETGALSGTVTFDAFTGGQDNNDISFSEVGIIALSANLVGDYLGSGEGLTGNVRNIGRFIPDHYSITSSAHIDRIGLDGFCSPASTFTYMGEPLQLTVNLEARNAGGQPTRNYYGAFERLSTVLGSLNFSAMDLDTMDVLSGRLDSTGINSVAWNNVFLNGDTGEGAVSGTLVLDKAAAPDGPYDMFTVGFVPVDADGVTALAAELNLDLPPLGSTDTITVMTTGIRYGRLILNSTGGSEISTSVVAGAGLDIPLTFVLEYFNEGAQNFVVNPLDDCTTLSSNNLQVINDSYTEGLTANPLGVGTASPSLSINIGVQTGTLTVLENGSTSSTSASGDTPFYISAPFAADDNNTATGSVLIEYDLDTAVDVDPGAGVQNVTYDYLKFDWRNVGELYDENPDGTTPDNPRAIIDFGVFQGHNRVINWQEILLTPE